MTRLQRIRQAITDRAYYLSAHAEDEMSADDLERADIEHAILHGRIDRRYTADPRGTRYRIAGPGPDGRTIRVVCRLPDFADMIVITVYAKRD